MTPAISAHQVPCSYTVQEIPAPPPCIWGPRPISPTGISPNGRYISGTYVQCGEYDEACVFDTQTWQLITIPRPPGVYSAWCNDVNDNGVAVGGWWNSASSMRGWMYTLPNGPWVELTPVIPTSSGWCEIAAVNSNNMACGYRSVSAGVTPQNAFTWSLKEGYKDLGVMNGPSSGAVAIADDGKVVGWTGFSNVIATNSRAFVHRDGKTIVFGPIPDGVNSSAKALNNHGDFLYYGKLAAGGTRTYLWRDGRLTQLFPLPGYTGVGAGTLTDSGIVMGASTSTNPTSWWGCLWYEGKPIDVHPMITNGQDIVLWGLIGALNSNVAVSQGRIDGYHTTMFLNPNPGKPGDANCDMVVNLNDLLAVINSWGPCSGCPMDFTADGVVNVNDLLVVLQNWG